MDLVERAAEVVLVPDRESAGVDREAVGRVGVGVDVRASADGGRSDRLIDDLRAGASTVESARVDRIEAGPGSRGRADGLLQVRLLVVDAESLRQEDNRLRPGNSGESIR